MSPLYTDRVAKALFGKREQFAESEQEIADSISRLRNMAGKFEALSVRDIQARLQELEVGGRFGARPTREQEDYPLMIPFQRGRRWTHHRLARDWAADVLTGVTTFAADGSVVDPSGDFSVPVGLVQIGWFQNPHLADQDYVKDVTIKVLSPDDFADVDSVDIETGWLRYQGEMEQAIQFMRGHQHGRAVVFLDGTLTISFVRNMLPGRQRQYRELIQQVMQVSADTGIPVVGYVDSSKAIDLMTLLVSLATGRKQNYDQVRRWRVSDAGLLRAYPAKIGWGDRCRTYICDRDDSTLDNRYYEDICFTYVQTTRHNPPARLEIPRWVFEDAELYEWVLNIVRAECVVGLGYPYALETADAVAVLTGQDRERFYRLFQEFADEHHIAVRMSRKSASKRGRRV